MFKTQRFKTQNSEHSGRGIILIWLSRKATCQEKELVPEIETETHRNMKDIEGRTVTVS